MQGRGPPLPRFLICWPVYTSLPQCGPEGPTHPYSWTPRLLHATGAAGTASLPGPGPTQSLEAGRHRSTHSSSSRSKPTVPCGATAQTVLN